MLLVDSISNPCLTLKYRTFYYIYSVFIHNSYFETDSMKLLKSDPSTLTSNSYEIFVNALYLAVTNVCTIWERWMNIPPIVQIAICRFPSAQQTLFLGDLRLAYLSDLLFGCKDSEKFSISILSDLISL